MQKLWTMLKMNPRYAKFSVGLGVFLFLAYAILGPNRNIINAKFEGTVFIKNSKNVRKNFTLYFYNYYYEKGDMYSATPLKIDSVKTDENGKYSIVLEKSNYVHIHLENDIKSTPIKMIDTRKHNTLNLEI